MFRITCESARARASHSVENKWEYIYNYVAISTKCIWENDACEWICVKADSRKIMNVLVDFVYVICRLCGEQVL